jgi:hypothetical protein
MTASAVASLGDAKRLAKRRVSDSRIDLAFFQLIELQFPYAGQRKRD